jgi:hypothetical protein
MTKSEGSPKSKCRNESRAPFRISGFVILSSFVPALRDHSSFKQWIRQHSVFLACTLRASPIPKGLCPPAQGSEERATLGVPWRSGFNPERVVPTPFPVQTQQGGASTLSGLSHSLGPFPRVARSSQPWALGWNPCGILARMPIGTDAFKVQFPTPHSALQ